MNAEQNNTIGSGDERSEEACSLKRVVRSFLAGVCRWLGHSYSEIDVLMFKIECEGRCYTVNLATGERKPLTRVPTITCRRCGVRLEGKAPNAPSSATAQEARPQ